MSMIRVEADDGWRAPWSAEAPMKIGYSFVGIDSGWTRAAPNFDGRDLGLAAASGGLMHAEHRRAIAAASPGAVAWQDHDLDFQFLYVLKGSMTVESDAAGRHTLGAGSVGLHSRLPRYAESGHSGDFEVIEITAPAKAGAMRGEGARSAARLRAQYLHETADSFVAGAGPRRYFAYRDLATADFTGRRVHIHVVKALAPMPGGTGWHTHTMSQIFVVLQGWAVLAVEGRDERRMHAGDAMCLSAGMRHDVPAYSSDYTVLEMCVPADYDTAAAPPPAAA